MTIEAATKRAEIIAKLAEVEDPSRFDRMLVGQLARRIVEDLSSLSTSQTAGLDCLDTSSSPGRLGSGMSPSGGLSSGRLAGSRQSEEGTPE